MLFLILLPVLFFDLIPDASADDGYRLWLRYDKIQDEDLRQDYLHQLRQIHYAGSSARIEKAKEELQRGISGLLAQKITFSDEPGNGPTLIAGTPESSPHIRSMELQGELRSLGEDGYLITRDRQNNIAIAASRDIGLLYGTFHFLRLLQSQQSLQDLDIKSAPQIQLRVLNHWFNLDGTAERGYAGGAIWQWEQLPDYKDPLYTDYARANASVGINGTVLNNVNSDALILTEGYLEKVKALADVFRPYGIKVYLSARFSAPIEIGNLSTADPRDPEVRRWWEKKANEIYSRIPDFGGFLVKANSEGQPGPQDYNRSHAEGANMLAKALSPHGGVVMWRAFVYSNEEPEDRVKQAYNEFTPLDGEFRDNVLVQVKNGPLDFQPREPFHPLFGAMPETPLMMEFQITQEYLGFATHLTYQAPLYEEVLDADTYAKGEGSYVRKVIDGSLDDKQLTGMAGVANIGTDRNWTGHPFAQANWYAYGRLAWNPELGSERIAEEWISMTFSNKEAFIEPVKEMMLASREIAVDYRTPLGLHHIMGYGSHYGPGPWVDEGRADWTSVYYHRADSSGIGFDRSTSGSNAVSQYHPPVKQQFNDIEKVPEKYLLWFHHVEWDYELDSGRTLWEGLVHHYYSGVDSIRRMQDTWESVEGYIDEQRYTHVARLLEIQEKEAAFWRDACVLYFQQFSGRPIPDAYPEPDHPLEYYQDPLNKYVPGL
ncbi:alpha-glucuronidase family glycosyl hydrolase [Fodinibius roseus]|nr:alpha-glucuronidase family glycosyl hydrolase [Fodinibius roseus]